MLRQKLSRLKYFLLVGLLSASFAVGLVSPTYAANAAESEISNELSGKVLDHQLYYYVLSCFAQADIDKVTSEEVKEWRWFWGGQERAVRGDMYEDEYTKCSEGWYLEEAFGRFGFTDPLDTFCSLSFTYNRDTGGLGQTENGGNSKTACKSGIDVGDFDGSGSRSNQATAAANLLKSSPKGDEAAGALSAPAEYVRKYRTFMQGCEITITDKYDEDADPAGKSDTVYKVPIVRRDASGKATVEYYTGQGLRSGFIQSLVATSTGGSKTTDCGQLVNDIRGLAAAYAAYLNSEAGQDDSTDRDEDTGAAEQVCSAGALGWIFCPISEFMVDAITGIAGFLEEQLAFEPLTFGPQGEAIRAMWGMVLVIANVGLIIAFLMVVFSQATSVGISSYGIKKLLPKIIAAAILMNLSFYICAVAVDISNILGVSVKSIVDVGMGVVYENRTDDAQVGASFGQSAIALTTGVMVGAIAVGTGAIALILPVLISGVLAVFTAFLIIAAREVIIIILIVVAPLAFLAWILPNTESWFTKWRKLFTTMLVMFPMVMAIFYGSVLVSSLIMATSTNEGGVAGNLNDLMVNVLAFAVLVVPLFSLPFVMKAAGGVMDRLGILVNNRNKGLVDRSRRAAANAQKNSRFSNAMAYRRENRDVARTVRRGAPTRFNRAMGAAGGSGYSAYTGRKAAAIEDKEFEQGVADAATGQKNYSSDRLDAIATGRDSSGNIVRSTGAERVAAARWVMQNGNFNQRQALYQSMSNIDQEKGTDTEDLKRLRQTVSSQYFAKGDNKILGSSYGGQLLEGVAGNENARADTLRANLADNLNKKKVDAQAMVHDADATQLIYEVASDPGRGVSAEAIDSLRRSATESLQNETTRTKATAGVYSEKIQKIEQLPIPPPPTPPTPPPAPPTPPPTPPPSGGGTP